LALASEGEAAIKKKVDTKRADRKNSLGETLGKIEKTTYVTRIAKRSGSVTGRIGSVGKGSPQTKKC